MKAFRLLVTMTLIMTISILVRGQTPPNLENGFKHYGSYDFTHVDTISNLNGNLMLNGAITPDYIQRGSLSLQDFVQQTSKNWQAICDSQSCQWKMTGQGVQVAASMGLTVQRTYNKAGSGTGTETFTAFGYTLTTVDGSTHQFSPVSGTLDATGEATKFDSIDSTGYHLEMSNADSNGVPTTATVTDRHGNQYVAVFLGGSAGSCGPAGSNNVGFNGGVAPLIDDSPMGDQYCPQQAYAQQVTDSNGNRILFSPSSFTGTDTLGRNFPLNGAGATTDFSGCTSRFSIGSAALLSYNAPDASVQHLKLCIGNVPVHTAFNASGILEFNQTVPQLVTIVLADGTKWTFDYDNFGEVISVGLPTGGSINYSWTTIDFPSCSSAPSGLSRAVSARTVNDNNGHSYQTGYQWGTLANHIITNTVTDPLLNDTVHVFTDLNQCAFFETSTKTYEGTGGSRQLLKQVDTSYSSAFFSIETDLGVGQGNVVPRTIQTTIYPSGKVNLVTKDYDSGPASGRPIFGNVVTEKIYDWGQGAAGSLLRETDTTYKWQISSSYLTAGLLDLPDSIIVKDGTGCVLSKTTYGYDETINGITLQAANISVQHFPPPLGVRGNQTSVNKYVWPLSIGACAAVPASASVVSHSIWYDTGEVYQQIDPQGHTTTHSYDAAYAGASGTKTCNALNQCVSGTYDFNTGMLTSYTNNNATLQASGNTKGDDQHTSTYSYDYMFRLTLAKAPPDPVSSLHAQSQFQYSPPNSSPLSVQLQKSTTDTMNDVNTAFFDGLARPFKTQHTLPNGTATVDTTFDGLGQVASASNPYFATTDGTYGVVQTAYDALGRVTSTTKQDNSVSSASYNIVTSISGTADCSISKDEAGQQRGNCTDALGRLVEVDEPIGNPVQAQNYVTLQSDSNFVVYNQAGNALWQSGTAGLNAPNIYMQDDGNLVLYTLRWMAGTYTTPVAGSYPQSACSIGTYLTRGEFLPSGKCITSPHGEYFLLMNSDGNLFIYDWYRAVGTWGPGTQGHPGAYALFQTDGNFVVYDANGTTVLWQSGTSGTNAERLDLLDDSRLMIWKSVWSSGTSNGQFGGTAIAHPSCDIGNGTGWTGVVGAGSCLVSPNGRFEMLMQTDGNLAIYDRSVNPPVGLWSVGTNISPADPGVAMRTLYSYDALGNLLCVEQHGSASTGTGCSAPASSDATSPWHVRRFTYDSLSRLLTATNPESGQISYSYDADGNMLQKTSPAPNQTGAVTQTISYCYDALHRIVAKGYGALSCPIAPGSAVVSYVYDQGTNGIGHLSSLTDQGGSASYSYDVLGRLSSEQRTIAGVSKSMSYAYNLDGSLKSLTYPSGAVVTYTPDSAGRVLSAVDTGNNINYVTSATYDASNALTGFVSGQSNSFAGITNSFSFNKRLQPVNMAASAPSQTVFSIGYDFHFGNGNNGNVYGITNYKDANRNQTFTYDALNRLATAQNAGTDCTVHLPDGHTEYWGNSYSYDALGNLTQKKVTKCSAENMNISADGHNWIHTITGADYTYDAAGNMTYNATSGQGYTYDQENRITGLSGYAYSYDSDGNRVIKTTTATPATGTLYWYMTPGIVAESDLSGAIKSEYVFFDGERVARRDTNSSVFYYFSDHLKTAAVETDSSGNIKDESDFYPWGGELQFTSSNDNHYKFTGKERDAETGLDYFGARYYGSALGRFITSDWSAVPVPVPYADLSDPQSLNLYSYVRNIPTVKVDADGHCCLEELEELATLVEEGAAEGAQMIATATTATVTAGVTVTATTGVVVYQSAQTTSAVIHENAAHSQELQSIHQYNQAMLAKQNNPAAQSQNQETQEQATQAEPQTAAGGAGQRTGGGRNEQKSNQNRQQSAADQLTKAKQDLAALRSKPNKTAEDTARVKQLEKQVKHLQKKATEQSETHSRKAKGQQQ